MEDSDNDSLVSGKKIKPALSMLSKLSNDFHRIKMTHQHEPQQPTSPPAGQSDNFKYENQHDIE
jgi:hypothetical protein